MWNVFNSIKLFRKVCAHMSGMFGTVPYSYFSLKKWGVYIHRCVIFSPANQRPPSRPPSSVILTFPFTGKYLKCTCTHACTHCSVAVSVVVGHYVPLFKILARPRSWIMLLRNRSVWKCLTALSCHPVDTKVKSRGELWLHRKHEEYYLDAVQHLLL